MLYGNIYLKFEVSTFWLDVMIKNIYTLPRFLLPVTCIFRRLFYPEFPFLMSSKYNQTSIKSLADVFQTDRGLDSIVSAFSLVHKLCITYGLYIISGNKYTVIATHKNNFIMTFILRNCQFALIE